VDVSLYIGAVRDLKREKLFPEKCKRRPSQYMNKIMEQDHRFMKRKIKPGPGFGSYPTAWRTIRGYKVMHMIRKEQIRGVEKGNIQAQNQFAAALFGLAM
jgi:IS6 family transposase